MLGGGRHTHEPTLHAGRGLVLSSISGLVVEYIVAIDVTRVRFPADAYFVLFCLWREWFKDIEDIVDYPL